MQVLAKGDGATIPLDKADRGVLVTATLLWDGHRHAKGDGGAAGGLDLYAMFVRRAEIAPRSARSGPVGRVSRGLGRKQDKADAARVVCYRNLGSLSEEPFLRLDGPREPGSETVRISRPDQQGYVLLCAHSAAGAGTGGFATRRARAVVTDGRDSTVTAPVYDQNDTSSWVAIALVDFTRPDGVRISQVEKYSAQGSERRPVLHSDGTFEMDLGPTGFDGLDPSQRAR